MSLSGRSRPSDKGSSRLSKKFFSALLASVWSKNKGRLASQAPPLDAPLSMQGFWYFAWSRSQEIQVTPQNPAKFTKTRKILQNLVKILSNRCLYNVFETYFSYWGYLLAVNLQIYLETSSLKRANNVVKLPGIDYVAKNWALAMMLKALPLVHFLSVLSLKEQN